MSVCLSRHQSQSFRSHGITNSTNSTSCRRSYLASHGVRVGNVKSESFITFGMLRCIGETLQNLRGISGLGCRQVVAKKCSKLASLQGVRNIWRGCNLVVHYIQRCGWRNVIKKSLFRFRALRLNYIKWDTVSFGSSS